MNNLTTCITFHTEAEEAAKYYVKVFQEAPGADASKSKVKTVALYPKSTEHVSGIAPGSVMTATFELNGQEFLALNGDFPFKKNESVSFMIYCDTQEEIDYYWSKLSTVPEAEICGWCRDQFGVSWQVGPRGMEEMSKHPEKFEKYMAAVLTMKKLIIKDLDAAANS